MALSVPGASLGTHLEFAGLARKSGVALAFPSSDALAVERARIRARLKLAAVTGTPDLALAYAVRQARSTRAVVRARLGRTRGSRPNLTFERRSSCHGSTLAQLVVRAPSMAGTIFGADLLGTVRSGESDVTLTGTARRTSSVEAARVGTRGNLTRGTLESLITFAGAGLGALSVVRTVERALSTVAGVTSPHLTVEPGLGLGNWIARACFRLWVAFAVYDVSHAAVIPAVAVVAVARSVVLTLAVVPAHVHAGFKLTARPGPSLLARADPVATDASARAFHRALELSAVVARVLGEALSLSVLDNALVFDNVAFLATVAFPSLGTLTRPVGARSAPAACERTRLRGAVDTLPALVAVANALLTQSVVVAVRDVWVLAAQNLAAAQSSVSSSPISGSVAFAHSIRTGTTSVAVFRARSEFAAVTSPALFAFAFAGDAARSMSGASSVAVGPSF